MLKGLRIEQVGAARPANSKRAHTALEETEARSRNGVGRPLSAHQPTTPVAIVDESVLLRTGLIHILTGSRFRITANCSELSEIADSKLGGRPCILLVELDKDPKTVLSRISGLMQVHENLHAIGLVKQFSSQGLLAAIDAGIDGYLLKNEISPGGLLVSLEAVLLGATVVPQGFTRLPLDDAAFPSGPAKPVDIGTSAGGAVPSGIGIQTESDDFSRLSARERQILIHLTEGKSNKEIARELDSADTTIKVHVKSLFRKLGVQNRTQAAMLAIKRLSTKAALVGLTITQWAQLSIRAEM